MLVYRRVTPSIKFTSTHLYTWVERGTVRPHCLAQEHSMMSPVRARTRTTLSGCESVKHEATGNGTLWMLCSKPYTNQSETWISAVLRHSYEMFRVQSLEMGKDCACVERRGFYPEQKVTKIFFHMPSVL